MQGMSAGMSDRAEPTGVAAFRARSCSETYPTGLRYDVVVPPTAAPNPDSAAEVEFYVPPYRFADPDLEVLAHLPRIRVVQTMTAGVDHIRAHLPDGVTLCNGRGIHDASTAELALALILSSLRGIPEFVRAQSKRDWAPETRPALADKSVLIVGYGQIGAAIEARLTPFEVDVRRVARTPRDGIHGLERCPSFSRRPTSSSSSSLAPPRPAIWSTPTSWRDEGRRTVGQCRPGAGCGHRCFGCRTGSQADYEPLWTSPIPNPFQPITRCGWLRTADLAARRRGQQCDGAAGLSAGPRATHSLRQAASRWRT